MLSHQKDMQKCCAVSNNKILPSKHKWVTVNRNKLIPCQAASPIATGVCTKRNKILSNNASPSAYTLLLLCSLLPLLSKTALSTRQITRCGAEMKKDFFPKKIYGTFAPPTGERVRSNRHVMETISLCSPPSASPTFNYWQWVSILNILFLLTPWYQLGSSNNLYWL